MPLPPAVQMSLSPMVLAVARGLGLGPALVPLFECGYPESWKQAQLGALLLERCADRLQPPQRGCGHWRDPQASGAATAQLRWQLLCEEERLTTAMLADSVMWLPCCLPLSRQIPQLVLQQLQVELQLQLQLQCQGGRW